MKLMVIGFPKSGTTSLTEALTASGLRTVHWRIPKKEFVGARIYEAIFRGLDPFALLQNYDAITQADVCLPAHKINFWPNLDFAVLSAIRRAHPSCLFLLNYRRPEAITDSISRWEDLQKRLTVSDIPGLPSGAGSKRTDLITWIENHFAACRRFFADDPHFLEIDIESPDAPNRLGEALGIEIVGWADYKAHTFEDEIAARNKVAERYAQGLGNVVGIPHLGAGCTSVWAQYTIRLPEGCDRDAFAATLKAQGIPTAIYYSKSMHQQTAYRDFPVADGALPVSERLSNDVISLPMHAYLDEPAQERIIAAVRGAVST